MEHILYAEIYLICSIVVGLLFVWTAKRETLSTPERKLKCVFGWFLCNFLANFFFTLANRLLTGPMQRPLSVALKTLYFLTMICSVGAWCAYAEAVQKTSLKRYRLTMSVVGAALALSLVPLIANFFTGSMFYFDEECVYHRSTAFNYFMLYLFAVSASFSVRLILHARTESDPNQRSALQQTALFPLCLLLAWVLCFVGESVPVIVVCIMIEMLFMYTGANNQLISKDKLTQVNNRQNLISFLNYKVHTHEEKLFIFMVDVDYFKEINDTYGHLEGDNALVDVVSALKKACIPFRKRPYIARYGGDEFIVVLEGTVGDAAAMKTSIPEILRESKRADAPYALQVSIGMAEYDPGMTPNDMIAAADEELYEIKRNRR
ncbi:MAG: GGDEF domain-containing protein [Clostridiales bacterium]|nr:GGDEF domain-containing protein [Clostridiales bacterium]